MYDRLDFFAPFHRLEPNQENQLTRALLVVLRYSSMAHTVWLRHVASGLHVLPRPTIATQTRGIRAASEEDREAACVSVDLAAPLTSDEIVVASDRGEVLNSVVDYGGELVVVEKRC